jgi:integrase/recombinase XerD
MRSQSDIHNYNKRYEQAKARVLNSNISNKNKNLIMDFDRTCFIEGLGKPRRIKLISSLLILARNYLKKDFDKATKKELKDLILKIESNENYSPWTKHSYRAILKKFYKWLEFGDEYKDRPDYPEIISWLRVNLKKKDQPKVKASDILTEKEIKKLIDAAEHPRDKAFISMLYELGARISEIGNLKIKDISRDRYSFLVDLNGKTGQRTARIVISDPYLANWLNVHPLKDNPNAPLWVMKGERNKNQKMQYQSFRVFVKRLAKKAKLKKRTYPHLFRHTRVTHLLINKQINETQAKVYFGWTPSSKMLAEYSHLVSDDVNNAILEIHGIKTKKVKESELKPKQCLRCKVINSADALYCDKCSSILDVKTAIELEEQRKGADEIGLLLVKHPKVIGAMLEVAKQNPKLGMKFREYLG